MGNSPISQPNRAAIAPSDLLIAQRVREIVGAGNLKQSDLAKKLGLSQPQVCRLLQGKTPWQTKYLQRLAKLYKTTWNALLLEIEKVPIVCEIADDQGFPYAATDDQAAWLGMTFAPLEEPSLYCLQIQGEFFKPFLGPGSLIYASRHSQDIQEDSLVIYVDEEGRGLLRQVKIANDTIILKSLLHSGQYIIRPKAHLRLLDKVEWIKL